MAASRKAHLEAEKYAAQAAKAQEKADKKASSSRASRGWGFKSSTSRASRDEVPADAEDERQNLQIRDPESKMAMREKSLVEQVDESIAKATADKNAPEPPPPPQSPRFGAGLFFKLTAKAEHAKTEVHHRHRDEEKEEEDARNAKAKAAEAKARAAKRAAEAEALAEDHDDDHEVVKAHERAARYSAQAVGAFSDLHEAEEELKRAEEKLQNLEKDSTLRVVLQGSAKKERKKKFQAFFADKEKSLTQQIKDGLVAIKDDYEREKAQKAEKLQKLVDETGYKVPQNFAERSWRLGGGPLWFLPEKFAPWRANEDPRGRKSNPGIFMYIKKEDRATKRPLSSENPFAPSASHGTNL